MLFMNGRGKWAGNTWVTHRWELPIIERRKAKGVHSRLSGKGYVPLILQFWPGLEALFLCRRRGLSFARGVWHLLYDVWDVLSTFAVPLYEHITGVSLSVLELEPLGCCSFYNVLNIAFISKVVQEGYPCRKKMLWCNNTCINLVCFFNRWNAVFKDVNLQISCFTNDFCWILKCSL